MRTKLRITNVNTYIEGGFPKTEIDKELSFYVDGFFMSKLYRFCPRCKGQQKISPHNGRCPVCNSIRAWDGKKHLLLGGTKPYFPTGCLSNVLPIMASKNIEIDYLDERKPCHRPNPDEAFTLELIDPDDETKIRKPWNHQAEAIHAALKYERGVVHAPTSAGKTSVLAGICKLINEPAIILIHNKSIATQLKQEIEAMLGEPVGLIMGGVFDPQRVTIAMVQSMVSQLSLDKESKKEKIPPNPDVLQVVKSCRVLLMDECHHGASNTWVGVANSFTEAVFRIGVTGTPFMRSGNDDLYMVGVTGPLIYQIGVQTLIELGIVAKPIIEFYTVPQPKLDDEITFQEAYRLGIVENDLFHDLVVSIVEKYRKENLQVLVLGQQIQHMQNVIAKLPEGMEYEFLSGDTDSTDRDEVKERFEKGEVSLVFASSIWNEGVSVNNIDVVVRMSSNKSAIISTQQTGRGMRKKRNRENVVLIVDFIHLTHRYLTEHSYERFKVYQDTGYEMKLIEQI